MTLMMTYRGIMNRGNSRKAHRYPVAAVVFPALLLLSIFAGQVLAVPLQQDVASPSMQGSSSFLFPSNRQMKFSSSEPIIDLKGRAGAQYFSDINRQINAGNYAAVIAQAKSVLAKQKNSALAYEILGAAYFLSRQPKLAIEALEKATRLDPKQAGPWTKLGIVRMEQGDIDDAEKLLNKAIKLDPANRFAYQRLGMLYEYRKDYPRAIAYYRKGLQGTDNSYLGVAVNLGNLYNQAGRYGNTIALLEPRLPMQSTVPEAHLVLATAYLATGKYALAKQRFTRVSALVPDSGEASLGIAISLRGTGKYQEALDIVDKLIAHNPERTDLLMEKGVIMLGLGRNKDAATAFDKAVKQGVKRVEVVKRKAGFYLETKAFAKAQATYRDSIRQGEDDPYIYMQLSELLQAQGKYKEGEKILRAGVKKFPKDADIHQRLGSYLASLRRYQDAIAPMKQALALSNNAPRVMQIYSVILAKAGKTKEAADVAGKLYKTAAGNPNAAVFYATQLQADKQEKAAEKIYRDTIKRYPDHALALNNLANLLADRSDFKQAEKYARHAYDIVQDNGNIIDTLGWILYRQKRYQEAAPLLEKAGKLEPKNAVIWYHKGKVLMEVSKGSEARKALKKALSLNATADWADDARGYLQQ